VIRALPSGVPGPGRDKGGNIATQVGNVTSGARGFGGGNIASQVGNVTNGTHGFSAGNLATQGGNFSISPTPTVPSTPRISAMGPAVPMHIDSLKRFGSGKGGNIPTWAGNVTSGTHGFGGGNIVPRSSKKESSRRRWVRTCIACGSSVDGKLSPLRLRPSCPRPCDHSECAGKFLQASQMNQFS